MNFDSYYDPPEDDRPCSICHYMDDDCTCPECEVCGEVGNPACINAHMPWDKFPHFHFQLSEAERKAEDERERMMEIMEQDAWHAVDKLDRAEAEVIECPHEKAGEDDEICSECGQRIAGPWEEIEIYLPHNDQVHRDDLE